MPQPHPRTAILQEILHTLTDNSSLESQFSSVLTALGRGMHFDRAAIVLWDARRKQFTCPAQSGLSEIMQQFLTGENGPAAQLLAEGAVCTSDNALQHPWLRAGGRAVSGLHSFAAIPFEANTLPLGSLFFFCTHPRTIPKTELAFAQSVAAGLALRAALAVFQSQKIFLEDYQAALLFMVTHGLRQPLYQAMELSIEAEKDLAGQDKSLPHLGEIRRALTRMEILVDGYLEYQQLAESREMERFCYNLNKLVEEVCAEFAVDAGQKKISMQTSFEPEALKVMGDGLLLRKMISHLIDNGIQYAPSGGKVQIGTKLVDARYVVFWVQDNGPGIPSEKQAYAFLPFRRLRESGRTDDASAGLGLSMARLIAEHHGGRVEVESAPRKGTRMRVILPRCMDE